VLSIEAVTVSFARRPDPVLRDVRLDLAPGEQVLVLGSSGTGKSTLLQLVSGVIPHSVVATVDGTVTVGGVDTRDTTVVELSRTVGLVAQDPASGVCLPTVEEEAALPLENRGVDPVAISGRIDTALAAAGVGHLRERRTARLSGGEGQRVALAAALVAEPAVLLLDEPTSMLDSAGVAAVRSAIASSVARYSPAVILVEHRLDEFAGRAGLDALPGRAIVLDAAGAVAADGPTREMLTVHGRDLIAAGCWLPLENELDAVFGGNAGAVPTRTGLASPEVRAGLLEFAGEPGSAPPTSTHHGAVPPVLATAGLAVSRERQPRRPRRGRGATVAPFAPVLSGVDLEVRPGEVVALLGANGAGKSTLLLTLAGLLPPAAGTVAGARPGMVFQNPEHQFVAHTVAGEVAFGLAPGPATDALVGRLLDDHGLAHLADQHPHRLSGGEKRRVSVAAMLAHGRDVLLADEPTFALDRRATIGVTGALRAAATDGTAVVFSSHDLRTVATLADRAVVIAEGGVVADGPVFDVLRDTAALESASIELPALVEWLLQNAGSDAGVRRALLRLDDRVPADRPVVGQSTAVRS
jgi:energy-coupling factor transporter ATP-binding protein EcfA2